MARKKAKKLDVRMDMVEEKMESVREGISKIPTWDGGDTY